MWPARNLSENLKEVSRNSFGIAYLVVSNVTLEGAVMDVHIGSRSINGPTLEVACGPPGIGAKI
jgi:hypothetical protein